jgi:hypothetical protein
MMQMQAQPSAKPGLVSPLQQQENIENVNNAMLRTLSKVNREFVNQVRSRSEMID